ncbi:MULTISPECIES: RNA-binding cell elongation regulator Jag/EloR [Clostridium]|uniref:RNA-binding protein KhpB n=5 Tax=Clostridium TaxID=1485 RepID=A0A2I4MS02_CLOBO|nr:MULTISPECIES: RNA-binding cell elongation regulator Jag/EloR [Clostridium]EKX81451.1 RNA-binding protein Jag [Clostridium botulinum CFSAN001628]ABS42846.1 R3H domain protein [Clostridium botulinum F str. Langeland]ACA44923.1 jag protein [Clostridium botulinum B1 str. Okra]ACO84912.1 jag protein [Clostridium botulinum A2 str. Kyoto]ADG01354.1 R3H domain protein [Clostridium botulinum F str. 230613]
MKVIEMTGKTIEEAINHGLKELNTSKDKVEIKVIDEGSKGFLNFIGTRPAKIEMKLKKDYEKEVRDFLESILKSMDVEAKISIKEKKDVIKIDLSGPDMGIIIGYRGETLDSLQYLVSLVINKDQSCDYKRVILDTENYRDKREETLKKLARRLGHKVRETGRPVKLEPMNPYERRIIHSELQNNNYVETYSEGEEPFRKVVINLRKA